MAKDVQPTADESRKVHCSQCGGDRNCGVRGKFSDNFDDGHTQGWTIWRILQCLGCEHVFVETVSTNSEQLDWDVDESGETVQSYLETKVYFPALEKRRKPAWMNEYGIDGTKSPKLDRVMIEIYTALGNDLNMIAGMGIRTVFDTAATLLGVDEGVRFNMKVKELTAKGLIGVVDEHNLETLIEAGNAAIHRGWRPTNQELDTMMDILEQFIARAFVEPAEEARLRVEAAKVKAVVPPQALRPKKTVVAPAVSLEAPKTS